MRATTGSGTRTGEGPAIRTGSVTAVCYSQDLINGVGKEPHEAAQITRWGIPGDRHYGETRINSKGQVVPNNRPITVVGIEAGREACERLGVREIPPGGLGENLLLEGLGDLSDLEPGDRLQVISEDGQVSAVLEARKQNEPCSNLMIYHKLMTRQLFGKRGVICSVVQEGPVRVGDKVELIRP